MLLFSYLYPFLFFPFLIGAQTPAGTGGGISARFLDSILQDYAFRSIFVRPRTGVVFAANVPSNLTGITVSAIRLRSGSFRKRGVQFHGGELLDVPSGIFVNPYVERLVLVNQNLGNWSDVFYPLSGYNYLAPVIGLLAYNASDLSATGLPELDLMPSGKPISIRFNNVNPGSTSKCVFFDLFGSVEFENVVNGSVCSSRKQGHFGLVSEGAPLSPAPAPAVEIPLPTGEVGGAGGESGEGWKKWWWVGGAVGGGVAVGVCMGFAILWMGRWRGRKRMGEMVAAAEGGVPFGMTAVGRAKLPVAMETRTRPVLEDEYVS